LRTYSPTKLCDGAEDRRPLWSATSSSLIVRRTHLLTERISTCCRSYRPREQSASARHLGKSASTLPDLRATCPNTYTVSFLTVLSMCMCSECTHFGRYIVIIRSLHHIALTSASADHCVINYTYLLTYCTVDRGVTLNTNLSVSQLIILS